jgi:HTH-type transcriptional regulator/antitoxin HigA
MATSNVPTSDLPIPPGEFLEEVLDDLGMSKAELARRMSRPAAKLSAIFKGEKAVTSDTALQLEKVVGVPAHIWTGLEAEYRLALSRRQEAEEQKRLRGEAGLVKKFGYSGLVTLGVVAKKTSPAEKALELQKFFGVTSLKNIFRVHRYEAAFRCGRKGRGKGSPEAMAAWLRIGELEAQKRRCAPFQEKALRSAVPAIRGMTQDDPAQFLGKLYELLAKAGVALVLCPHLSGTYAHGATFWIGREKAVMMMTIRGKWADIFWFSLFHELGHVLLHARQTLFIEGLDGDPSLQEQEKEADEFAADTLIPRAKYDAFVRKGRFYREDIMSFVDAIGVAPGMVVGRLQHDGHLQRSWHNDLRVRYEWSGGS